MVNAWQQGSTQGNNAEKGSMLPLSSLPLLRTTGGSPSKEATQLSSGGEKDKKEGANKAWMTARYEYVLSNGGREAVHKVPGPGAHS